MPTVARLRIDHLYVVSALALAGFVVALMPIVPHDFWWHMAIGREIARTGQIPAIDQYSWAVPSGTPFVYQSWLSEWLLFRVYEAGGMAAIVWLRNGLLVLTWAVLAWDARRRSGSWRLAALAIGGLTLLTVNNMTMRPQTFSWLPFALFVVLLAAYRDRAVRGRALLALPPLMALWVNLHGAFILGIAVVLLTVVGETLAALIVTDERRTTNDERPPTDKVLPVPADCPLPTANSQLRWARVRWLAAIAGATVLATLVNPAGVGVWGYVGNLLGSQPVQGLVSEWQPLSLGSEAGVLFGASVVLSIAAFGRARARVPLTDLLLWAAFLWLALGGVRSVLWWAMLAWPMIVQTLRTATPPRRQPPRTVANTALAALIMLVPLVAQPPFKPLLTLPPVFGGLGNSVPDGTLVTADTPVRAVAWLREHPLPRDARLFHDMAYGSYLIWALPDHKVYVDPRIELYAYDEWMRYKRITAACRYNATLGEMGVTHLLLDRTNEADLIAALDRDTAWTTIYSDDTSTIYERTSMVAYDASCRAPS